MDEALKYLVSESLASGPGFGTVLGAGIYHSKLLSCVQLAANNYQWLVD